jgi:hypothetical protein
VLLATVNEKLRGSGKCSSDGNDGGGENEDEGPRGTKGKMPMELTFRVEKGSLYVAYVSRSRCTYDLGEVYL